MVEEPVIVRLELLTLLGFAALRSLLVSGHSKLADDEQILIVEFTWVINIVLLLGKV